MEYEQIVKCGEDIRSKTDDHKKVGKPIVVLK